MEALRPLLPILAISVKFHAYAREISNLLPNSGREKWCEILRENLERPVRIFQKCVSLGRRALLKLFHAVVRMLTQHVWRPFGTLRDNFHINFHTNFHTNFTQFSHTGLEGRLGAFWARPGEAKPSSPATRFAWISGPLLRPPGARLAKMRAMPRIMRNPANSHRLRPVCMAICRRMVPLTWRWHPELAPRRITATAPQSEKTREIFGPTGTLGARRRQRKRSCK